MPTQIELLKKHGLPIRGTMGQHLLIDPNTQRKIVDWLDPGPKEKIFEIGPGLGALTGEILERGASVTAVEKDERFVPVLQEEFSRYGKKFKLVSADALELDFSKLLKPAAGKRLKVISNLPYYITAPLVLKLAQARTIFSEAVLTMQKEVARRLTAQPGSKDYSRLTLAVRYGAAVEQGFDISKACFTPAPEVDSSVVKLVFHRGPALLKPGDEHFLFELIRVGFSQRRKTFLNVLSRDPLTGKSREALARVFQSLGFSETVRAEELLLKDFIRLGTVLRGTGLKISFLLNLSPSEPSPKRYP